MEHIKLKFDQIKGSSNPEIINDFIITLTENPKKEYLEYLRYLIESLNPQILDKIKLNLIFALGEIGNLTFIEEYYLNFINETYYRSDRWIRNEIIQTINKISKNSNLNEDIIQLIGNALNDDYNLIQINVLKVLLNLKPFPDFIFTNLFRILNSIDSEVLEGCKRVLEKKNLDTHQLFNLLNQSENYKLLKPRAIRSLLLIHFKSLITAESFREMIINSNWIKVDIETYLKELDTFERIFIKTM